jgi:thioredoxin 1
MKTNKKIYPVALTAITLFLFLIIASSTAVASGQPAVKGSSLTAITDGNSVSSGNMHVYYLDSNGHVCELAWFNGKWYARDVTKDAGGQPAVNGSSLAGTVDGNSASSGNMHVYYLDSEGHVRELAWFNGKWYARDVTYDAGGQPAVKGSPLIALTDGNSASSGNMHVYYLDSEGHVRELAWFNGKWYARDVTKDAGGQPAVNGSSLAGTVDGNSASSGNMHVYYLDSEGHVRELAVFDGKWYPRDVTYDAGGQPAVNGSSLTAITDKNSASSGNMHVYYLDSNGHVRELAVFDGKWYPRDVTKDAGGQPAVNGSSLASTVDGNSASSGNMHVYYLDSEGHARELAMFNSNWYARDVTYDAGGQPAVNGSSLAGTVDGNSASSGNMHVYYLDSYGHVRELAVFDGKWVSGDLTALTTNTVVEVTQLEQINASLQNGPCLLKIGAEWCTPCKQMKPILNELATEYAGKATIMSVDINKSPKIAEYFGVEFIPDTSVIVGIENGAYVYMQNNGNITKDRSQARIIGLNSKQVYENIMNLALQ